MTRRKSMYIIIRKGVVVVHCSVVLYINILLYYVTYTAAPADDLVPKRFIRFELFFKNNSPPARRIIL